MSTTTSVLKIVVFGAAGNVGRRVVDEALARGHHVTAVVRDAARFPELPPGAVPRVGDAANPEDVAALTAGQDVAVGATRPALGDEGALVAAAEGLVAGAEKSGVRLLLVGGAGSLLLPGAGGLTVEEGPDFPADWLPIARACTAQLAVVRNAPLAVDWAYVSPAASLEPGVRTGVFRLGADELVVDADGVSAISMEDLAVALVDEAEHPKHHRSRFTLGY